MKKLPKTVFVSERTYEGDDPVLLVFRTEPEAIEEDGPSLVGTYQLVETRRLVKVVQSP